MSQKFVTRIALFLFSGFVLIHSAQPLCGDATAEVTAKPTEKQSLQDVSVADGSVTFSALQAWKAKPLRSRIVEKEFAIPPVKGDSIPGRLTVMRSGGSLKANVERWYGQFTQADGRPTKDAAKVTSKQINGQKATIVDISGTFSERMGGGPFAPGKTVAREKYRMLGGIVQTKASGQYFFKLYGPQSTIAAAEKHFLQMLNSVKSTDKR